MSIVTFIAPVNIAVIKYWGKRDENLILPINDSISATLETEHLCAKTTIMASLDFKEDKLWLNGREESINNTRLQNCIQELRKRAQLSNELNNWKLHICSENNFPTAAGLASSAAGYACLVSALSKLFKVEGDISGVARLGSGSACRSIYGGFVRWYMGSDPRGNDSLSKQIAPTSHWPEMRILVLVVNETKKKISSAIGMKRSVMNSELLKYRAEKICPERVEKMQQAIISKNFQTFAELTMKDSNQMHATCLDSYPPYIYLNDTSFQIIDLVHVYNAANNSIKVCYTYDAGPNATLFLLEKDVPEFAGILDYYFPPTEDANVEYRRGIPLETTLPSQEILQKLTFTKQLPGKLKYIIQTRIGNGPKQINNDEAHLLNSLGLPVKSLISSS